MHRYTLLLLVLALLAPTLAHAADPRAMAPTVASRWARDDAPVADGIARRSWTWGPDVLRSGSEPYTQAPNGQRQVWYLDKARMEVTHPDADPQAAWYITTGLLVRELISGQMQLGDSDYEPRQPAGVPVAGDLEALPATTITYADLRLLASIDGRARSSARQSGDPPIATAISPGGSVALDDRFTQYGVRFGGYDAVLGHNLAKVFLDALGTDTLLYVAGRPLTEPYWARVPVGRQPHDVLLQAFERRVLTYTPDNPTGWQVEWGNVGRQYAEWRYGRPGTPASPPPPAPTAPIVQVRQLQELSPAAAEIAHLREGYVGAAVYQPDTGTLYSFHSDWHFAMYSTAKVPIMLAVLDRALKEHRDLSAWERDRIAAMITVSDNAAASQLLDATGGATAVEGYLRRIGLTGTTINGDAWGASMTTAQDMAMLLAKLGACTILAPPLCGYALDTMRHVVPSQHWGVSAGVPASATVALKNGWYPDAQGWGVNSIGLVVDPTKRYTVAIYTNPDPSMQYGIDTIEQMSAQIYPALH